MQVFDEMPRVEAMANDRIMSSIGIFVLDDRFIP